MARLAALISPHLTPPPRAPSEAGDVAPLFSLADHIAYFFFYFQRQLEGVHAFYEGERSILAKRLEEITSRLPAVRQAAAENLLHKELDALVGVSRAVLDDLHDLHNFAVSNVRQTRPLRVSVPKKQSALTRRPFSPTPSTPGGRLPEDYQKV